MSSETYRIAEEMRTRFSVDGLKPSSDKIANSPEEVALFLEACADRIEALENVTRPRKGVLT